ncbi:MAG: AAA family ATPase [Lachnospiraceae bacterium]|nr:AAA family ATPase [Lachnospiraceae bacterium]
MVFTGNPGTARTTVARLFAQMLKDEKVLPTGQFVEVGRGDLISDHVGGTALLVKEKFREAQGGVLFIDEAYSLCDDRKNSFGDEAISTIVQEMENSRDRVIVIFAGYPEPMKEFLDRNPGMSSRIAFRINFDDYTVEELCEITKLMVSKKEMSITDGAMEKLRNAYWKVNRTSDFGNGRFVRKLLEEAQMNLAERLLDLADPDVSREMLTTIEEIDIPDTTTLTEKPMKLGFGF